jgi:hypothetical protein
MRCVICDVLLSDFEATRKHADTGEYLDTCNKCLSYTKIPTIDNYDLADNEDIANMDEVSSDDQWYIDFEN